VTIPDSLTLIQERAFAYNPSYSQVAVKGYRAAGGTGITVESNANIVIKERDTTTPLTGQVVNKSQSPVMAVVQGETES